MRMLLSALAAATVVFGLAGQAAAHCQIPCGIYDDELRVQLIEEHITTIEKSMNQVASLGSQSPINFNQLVRWIVNKEEHAQKIQDIATAYFMAQRVKLPDATEGDAYDNYIKQLTLLHQIQVVAMEAKQSTDLAHIEKLRTLVKEFRTAYFGKAERESHQH
jgi:nickel superoxide dismutase